MEKDNSAISKRKPMNLIHSLQMMKALIYLKFSLNT